MVQASLYRVSHSERRREGVCSLCHGYRRLCGKAICPILVKASTLVNLKQVIGSDVLSGPSPPSAFLGSYGYPRIMAGPLVPPLPSPDPSLMDLPEAWIDLGLEEILRYRFSLVRGKTAVRVESASRPDRLLSAIQEAVMAERPVDMELHLAGRPNLGILLSPRAPPVGPSGILERAIIAENPKVARKVDNIVSDRDMRSVEGVLELYRADLPQTHITRIFSAGLLGQERMRRLVPTEWSITAVDDILGRSLYKRVLHLPWIGNYSVFGHAALGNNVQVLLLPSSYMFEALEAWLTSANPVPASDHEYEYGRSQYAHNLEGAYYAARLPVLEYLSGASRQAGAVVFLEVYPEWIPLGVWRFREICRRALTKRPVETNSLKEALDVIGSRLRLPLWQWLRQSSILRYHQSQTRITSFLEKDLRAHRGR